MCDKDGGVRLGEGLLAPNLASLLASLSALLSRMSEWMRILGK